MIGHAYRNAEDTRRARVWLRADGTWDYEVVRLWPGGGWSHMMHPAPEDEPVYDTKELALMHVGDYLQDRRGDELIPLGRAELTEGWPERPVYVTPEGAPEIKAGQTWRRGQQVTRVLDVYRNDGVLKVTTQNVVSARPPSGTAIRNRKPAAHTYSEKDFRAKFKLYDLIVRKRGGPS